MWYILRNRKPVRVSDPIEWVRWAKHHPHGSRVGKDEVGPLSVSTVFLMIGMEPLLFETMVFGGDKGIYCERYSTWEEAEAGHQRAIEWARERVTEAEKAVEF